MQSKVNTNMSLKENDVDRNLRRLLLCIPSIRVTEAKEQLERLKIMKDEEKDEMIKMLNTVYKKDGSKFTKESVRSRVQKWEELIESVDNNDIAEMLKSTSISLMDVFPERMTPQHLVNYLNQYLFGQEEYVRKLSLAFYLHFLSKEKDNLFFPKTNLLVHGPSGTGKTYGAKKMAEFFDLPFCVINCNSLVQEGIVGNSIQNFFTALYKKYKEETVHAVILLDEFDKLLEKGEYNERILNEMLNLIDDNNSITFRETDEAYHYGTVTLPTNKMLFIFTGVFRGIEDIIKKRLGKKQIGFEQSSRSTLTGDYHQYATEEDFEKYFNRPELSGRIQRYAYVKELQAEDMARLLLNSKESPVTGFENYFQVREIEFSMTEDGAMALARAASDKQLGVRGLKSLMLNALSEDMFLLDNKKIIMDEDYVEMKLA